MPTWFELYEQHRDSLLATVVTAMQREIPEYAALPRAEVEQRVGPGLAAYARDLDAATPTEFRGYWQKVGYQRAQQGMPLPALFAVLLIGAQEMIAGLNTMAGDPETRARLAEKAYAVTMTGVTAVSETYDQVQQEVIAAQQSTLEELSTPIVPIYQGILVLPVIGTIDSRRAGQIMEGLLDGISLQSADVVIMDITGVPLIDTGVANYLLQAARAARLLGSEVVLVGIGAEIAQTIVQLGIDLTGIATRANLQAGIEYALESQGVGIQPLQRSDA